MDLGEHLVDLSLVSRGLGGGKLGRKMVCDVQASCHGLPPGWARDGVGLHVEDRSMVNSCSPYLGFALV